MTARQHAAARHRPPLVGGHTWAGALDRADDRCECIGHCGRDHASGQGRCPHAEGPGRHLHVAPLDPLTPLPVATGLPVEQLRAWCSACMTAIARAARRDALPAADQPDLFGDTA
jgi:hypothetical protein